MKTKILLPILALSALLISTGTTLAQPAPVFGGMPVVAPIIDPTTGLPVTAPVEPWMDEKWKDPAKTLKEVAYAGLPISEVAADLEKQFTNTFDILLPHAREGGTGGEARDWLSTEVHLRLKNVTASEIFNAMNLVFENNRTPLRWALKINGRRQVALLRILEQPVLQSERGSPQHPWRKIFFVGDLMGDVETPGMTLQQIVDTVSEVYRMSYGQAMGGVQFHKHAQLLIVTVTAEQMDLIEQTLASLKQKVELDRSRAPKSSSSPSASKPAPEDPKPKSPK